MEKKDYICAGGLVYFVVNYDNFPFPYPMILSTPINDPGYLECARGTKYAVSSAT